MGKTPINNPLRNSLAPKVLAYSGNTGMQTPKPMVLSRIVMKMTVN
nr:hypothetical protein [Verrucomicrobium spinosum]